MKKLISNLLSIFIGLVFLFSASVKIYPMEPFEYQFVDIGLANWDTSPYMARIFISLEFIIGFLLVFNIYLKQFTIKFAVGLLFLFNVYLLYKIYLDGNAGNCGCFGEALEMTPLEAIVKNCILIALLINVFSITSNNPWADFHLKLPKSIINLYAEIKNKQWVSWLKKATIPYLAILSLCLGFLIYPINVNLSSTLDKRKVNYKVPLELMYSNNQKEKPIVNLLKGKHIIAFLSLTCPHCKIAANKINIIHKINPKIPFYLALNGDKILEMEFLKKTNTLEIPHNLFLGPKDWINVAGVSLPIIMYIENGIVIKKTNGIELDQKDIEQWLNN